MRRNVWMFLSVMVIVGMSGLIFGASADARNSTPVRAKKVRLRSMPVSLMLNLGKTSLVPGGKVNAQWTVEGSPTGLELWISAREPGDTYATSGPLAYHPGVRPPTGRMFHLKANGLWDATPGAYQRARRLGRMRLRLPNNEEGQWLIEATLRSRKDGSISTYDAVTLLVSSGPQINLRLNRPIANSTDQVYAELITSAGTTPRNVILSATLTLPDNSQRSLPGLSPGLHFLYKGRSGDAQYILLDRHLGSLGLGNYRIKVRMVDGDTGALLAMADGGFLVCDTQGTVSGTVYDDSGLPLPGGDNPSSAFVEAVEINDGSVTAVSPVATNGTYSLNLEPGIYRISAQVDDAAGRHTATAPHPTIIDCDGGHTILDFQSRSPVPLDGRALAGKRQAAPLMTAAQTDSCPGVFPKPGIYVFPTSNSMSRDDMLEKFLTFSGELRHLLQGQQGSVDYLTFSQVTVELNRRAREMQMGEEFCSTGGLCSQYGGNIDNMAQLTAKPFQLALNLQDSRAGKSVTSTISDLQTGAIIWRAERRGGTFQEEWMGELAAEAAMPDGQPLCEFLFAHQERPILPELAFSLSPYNVESGGLVVLSAVLKDADGALQVGEPLTFQYERFQVELGTVEVTTGNDAGAHSEIHTSNVTSSPLGVAKVSYQKHGKTWRGVDLYYRVTGPSDLSLQSNDAHLRYGDATEVCARLTRNTQPVAGATIILNAGNGVLNTTTVMTGADGRGCASFTAGNNSGLAQVSAQTQLPSNSPQMYASSMDLSANLDFMVDGGVAVNVNASSPTVYTGGISDIAVDVSVGGAQIAALPVRFTIQGAGSLSVESSQTDANGHVGVQYFSPLAGTGSAIITAIVTVDDRDYTGTVTLNYQPYGCQPPAGASYCITDLEIPNGTATGINNSGQIVGYTFDGYPSRSFIWKSGTATTYIDDFLATGINDAGQVVGRVSPRTAGIWENGTITDLGTLGGTGSTAYAINNAGQVVGNSYNAQQQSRAFLWQDNSMQDLGALDNDPPVSIAYGINSYGHIVGQSRTVVDSHVVDHAILWQGNSMIDLNASDTQVTGAEALAINDIGQIVGGFTHATRWENGSMTDLGSLGTGSEAHAINNSGEIVGRANVPGGWPIFWHAVIWKNGVDIQDLNNLIDPNSGWVLVWARDINDRGQIAGWGMHNGETRAFLLTPQGQ